MVSTQFCPRNYDKHVFSFGLSHSFLDLCRSQFLSFFPGFGSVAKKLSVLYTIIGRVQTSGGDLLSLLHTDYSLRSIFNYFNQRKNMLVGEQMITYWMVPPIFYQVFNKIHKQTQIIPQH
jgi:hypothetical protein